MPSTARRRIEAPAERPPIEEMKAHAADAAQLLKALANEQRLLILCNLLEKPRTVGELNECVDLSQSALSQHLAVLRRKHLVRTRRDGQSIFYSLSSGEAASIMHTLHEQFCRRR